MNAFVSASLMSSPFADRTNVTQGEEETPKAVCLESPAPPPPQTPVAAIPEPVPAKPLDAFLAHVPTLSNTEGASVAGAHAAAFVFYLSGTSPIATVGLVALVALVANGVAVSFANPPQAFEPLSAAAIMPGVEAALALVDRYRRGEPRLSFGTAIAAYCLTIMRGSMFTLAWIIGVGALTTKWAQAQGYTDRLAPHAAKLQTYLAGMTARVVVPPALKQFWDTARECAPASVAYAPLLGVFVWAYFLGWYQKALTLGMGVLGYRVWASPEESSKIAANIKKAGRRMTMGAGELVRMASGAKAKDN